MADYFIGYLGPASATHRQVINSTGTASRDVPVRMRAWILSDTLLLLWL
jgi:hypothetical protein